MDAVTSEKLQIRKATADDIDAMTDLLGELFSIEVDFIANPKKQRRGLTELLAQDNSCVLVCEEDGQVVGMCTVQLLISTAEGGKAGLLEDLVVTDSRRGRGVGTALLRAAEEWSAGQGATRLQLVADAMNGPALQFYLGKGWASTRLVVLRKTF